MAAGDQLQFSDRPAAKGKDLPEKESCVAPLTILKGHPIHLLYTSTSVIVIDELNNHEYMPAVKQNRRDLSADRAEICVTAADYLLRHGFAAAVI
jgi:hypothetical protein